MKDSTVAREWLAASARTANAKDFEAHMDLISRKVQVFGVPGLEVIGYDDWAKQCRHEFETGVLKNVSYDGMKVQVMTPGRVMFKTTACAGPRDARQDFQVSLAHSVRAGATIPGLAPLARASAARRSSGARFRRAPDARPPWLSGAAARPLRPPGRPPP